MNIKHLKHSTHHLSVLLAVESHKGVALARVINIGNHSKLLKFGLNSF